MKMPSFIKFGGKGKVKEPQIDGILSGSEPDIKIKGPKVKAPKGNVDVDLNLGGGADVDVKAPKADLEIGADLTFGGDVDIKRPEIKADKDIQKADVDLDADRPKRKTSFKFLNLWEKFVGKGKLKGPNEVEQVSTAPVGTLKRFANTDIGANSTAVRGYDYVLSLFDPTERRHDDDHKGVWRDAGSIELQVNGKPFANGGFRNVFKATDTKAGKDYVVKRYRNHIKDHIINELQKEINEHARIDVQKTVGIASYYAIKFSAESGHRLKYLPVYLSEDHETVFIESFVDAGDVAFKKYIGNEGQLMPDKPPKEQEICEAFVHYTLHKSKGELMVCDIQGWFPLLCDPEIASRDTDPCNPDGKSSTAGNWGKVAINKFARSHICSSLCGELQLSTLSVNLKEDLSGSSKEGSSVHKNKATSRMRLEAAPYEKVFPKMKTELNILIMGEIGVGKSTWINSLANYSKFETLKSAIEDQESKNNHLVLIPSKLMFIRDGHTHVIRVGRPDPNEIHSDSLGVANTVSPKTHSVNIGDSVLNLIDTPGFGGDSFQQDAENMEKTLTHLSQYKELHGIIMVLKPTDSRIRLLSGYDYWLQQLLLHLHKDAVNNISFVFTNARATFYRPGQTLKALREMLKEDNTGIEATETNLFLYDNEGFRVLAFALNGIKYDEYEMGVYEESWKRAWKETKRLLEHILFLSRKPLVVREITLLPADHSSWKRKKHSNRGRKRRSTLKPNIS